MGQRSIMSLMVIVGAVLLFGGLAGLCSLYAASQEYERTTGTVRSIQTKQFYRGKKIRYNSKMSVSYPTSKYGNVVAVTESYCPFRREGDKLTVWYHPDRPRDICLPYGECCLWGVLLVSGMVCIYGGRAVRKNSKQIK